jgi:hypothetical protein
VDVGLGVAGYLGDASGILVCIFTLCDPNVFLPTFDLDAPEPSPPPVDVASEGEYDEESAEGEHEEEVGEGEYEEDLRKGEHEEGVGQGGHEEEVGEGEHEEEVGEGEYEEGVGEEEYEEDESNVSVVPEPSTPAVDVSYEKCDDEEP